MIQERTLYIYESDMIEKAIDTGALRYMLRKIVDVIDKLDEREYTPNYWDCICDTQDLIQQAERILE